MKGSTGFLFALGSIVLGGILISSAFKTPPDPRTVLATAIGIKPKVVPIGKGRAPVRASQSSGS